MPPFTPRTHGDLYDALTPAEDGLVGEGTSTSGAKNHLSLKHYIGVGIGGGAVGLIAIVAMKMGASMPGRDSMMLWLYAGVCVQTVVTIVVVMRRREKSPPKTHLNPYYRPASYYIACLLDGKQRKNMSRYERKTLWVCTTFVVMSVLFVIGLAIPSEPIKPDHCETAWQNDYIYRGQSGSLTHDAYIEMCHKTQDEINDGKIVP